MGTTPDGTKTPRAVIHKQILDAAERRPNASLEGLAGQVSGASVGLVEEVLEEYGDPGESAEGEPEYPAAADGATEPEPEPEPQSQTPDDPREEPAYEPASAPVAEGETRVVEIDSIGDKGDGVARIDGGYVVIVADAEVGERLRVEMNQVRENVAFAEVVERLPYYE